MKASYHEDASSMERKCQEPCLLKVISQGTAENIHGWTMQKKLGSHKTRSLPPAWSNLAMTMRTKPDVDTLSIDDLYNNLRVFEQELTSTSKSSASGYKKLLFVFTTARSSTNKVKSWSITGAYSTYTPSLLQTIFLEKSSCCGPNLVMEHANRVNHANHFVPRPVQLNAVRQNVNSVRPNVNTGMANVNYVRQNVNSVRTNVNTRSFNINTVRAKQPIHTSNSNSFSLVRPQDHPLKNMEDRGTSEVTNSAGTLQTPNANASEKEDEAEELIVVPIVVRHTTSKVGPRKSSTNSKAEEFLTALQNLKTQENEAYSTGISEDTPEILAFRR
ncbi:hypothetical protein Tco_1054958 [Tanacetum coccineum]|uniref:Uncharacterized protein n=1 Tax=Tanacetum coccineum TaxID=301880 RepID=A0ABQ5GY98_9ASTR